MSSQCAIKAAGETEQIRGNATSERLVAIPIDTGARFCWLVFFTASGGRRVECVNEALGDGNLTLPRELPPAKRSLHGDVGDACVQEAVSLERGDDRSQLWQVLNACGVREPEDPEARTLEFHDPEDTEDGVVVLAGERQPCQILCGTQGFNGVLGSSSPRFAEESIGVE